MKNKKLVNEVMKFVNKRSDVKIIFNCKTKFVNEK